MVIKVELKRLKEIREKHENTQLEIAQILGVKRGTYASWECNSDIIPTKQLYKFAQNYQTSVDYLFGLINKNKNITIREINQVTIGENLKQIRTELKLSQKSIAESIGINQSTWWAYEKGQTLITTTTLFSLSEKYNYSADWILGLSTQKTQKKSKT